MSDQTFSTGIPDSLSAVVLGPGFVALALLPVLASMPSSKVWVSAAVVLVLVAVAAGVAWMQLNKKMVLVKETAAEYKESLTDLIVKGLMISIGAAAYTAFVLRNSSYETIAKGAIMVLLLVGGAMGIAGSIATSDLDKKSIYDD